MTADRAAAETPHPLAIAMMAVVAGLIPLVVFGNRTALLALAATLIPVTLWAVIRHPGASWLLTVACLPLTMAVPIASTGVTISLPLEVLAGILAPLLLFALIRDPPTCSRLLVHPLSIAVGVQLAWMAVSSLFSTDPVVSVKALAVRVVYLTVFYFGGLLFLDRALPGPNRDPVRSTTTAVLFFAAPTTLWAFARHVPEGFARLESYEIAQPFFSNHTEYATILVVWLCLAVGLRQDESGRRRTGLTLLLVLLFAAVLAAGARSAWIALPAAIATLVGLHYRPEALKTTTVVVLIALVSGAAVVGVAGLHVDRTSGFGKAGESRPAADWLFSHETVGGESSLERLNRWLCAARMLRDRPLFGFGPGTYERNYGGYQQPQQLTRVSTFRGDRGGAHSEYMTVAAEQGMGGVLTLLAVVILGLHSGATAVRNATTARGRRWAAVWTAVFVALGVSSCFNSLLELDKTAPLFWLAAAVLAHLNDGSSGSRDDTAKDGQGLLGSPSPAETA